MKNVKIAYVGGGSKLWGRVFQYDLALTEAICGEISLYDIDIPAAERNKKLGDRINEDPRVKSKWQYTVAKTIGEALDGADFVVLSILPGTFDEMECDVHAPEKYGVYQSVGDTVGPGGVLRAMRTVPIYEGFAREIKERCPGAWVINLTNPMTACTQTLFDVFPAIKAFGCCHEVFHAQEFLSCVAHEELKIPRPHRSEITIDASGVNHFTWITEANYKGVDLLKLLPRFIEKFYERGYGEQIGHAPDDFADNPFLYGNKVKMDLFLRYGALAAAGDRHLVEFMNPDWYLSDERTAEKWLYHLTSVDYRRADCAAKIADAEAMIAGRKRVPVARSDEEVTYLMLSVLGYGKRVSNVNMPNRGQMPEMPEGLVVETNCVFDSDSVKPVVANKLPPAVQALVYRNAMNIKTCCDGVKARDIDMIFSSFVNQPLLSRLTVDEARSLFSEMVRGTKKYLEPYYDLSGIL